MQGKFFACKKCDYRNKDARNDLEKIQLVKYAKLSLFIIIEGCAIADIPNLFEELGDLVLGSLKYLCLMQSV